MSTMVERGRRTGPYTDLRDWLRAVEGMGELRQVDGATWEEDIGRITEMLHHTDESPAVVDFSSIVRGSVASTRSIGASWIDERTYAVLSVPSSIIPEERNYVLNIAHPDFRNIEFLPSKPFHFDLRLKPTAK